MSPPFVPPGFDPPDGLAAERFVLEPLGPEHNERDHAAWMSSIEHIHATPGFGADPTDDSSWPAPMTLEENLRDMERHARDFGEGIGFTYTVLDPSTRDVIGCLYVYAPVDDEHDAQVRSWVRASHADLDREVRAAVSAWLVSDVWPFERPAYATRS